ncbi:MAG: AmmeMemoRadiSam system protein A, partial [Eggerthellaceae bacterium]|nr:AmmeMemoRadiSam system protein A [Eggerthellaceae bacterium]
MLSYEGPFGVGYGVAAFEVVEGKREGQPDTKRAEEGNESSNDEALSQASTLKSDAADGAAASALGVEDDNRDVGNDCDQIASEAPTDSATPDPYVSLARASFTAYTLRKEHIAIPDDVPEEMKTTRAGAFVSLHMDGDLRGCIGTLGPVRKNLAEEIICNAIAACSEDPRFPPVTPEELLFIDCSVDVLGEPEDIEGLGQLDVKRYGVIVSRGWRRGVLLPDLEGVETVELQVAIAKQKA